MKYTKRQFIKSSLLVAGYSAALMDALDHKIAFGDDEFPSDALIGERIHMSAFPDRAAENADGLGLPKSFDLLRAPFTEARSAFARDMKVSKRWEDNVLFSCADYGGLPIRDGEVETEPRMKITPDYVMDTIRRKTIGKGTERLGEEQTLFFFYNGHGGTDPEKGHYLALSGGNLFRSELKEMINESDAHLKVIITDCCSNIAPVAPTLQRRKPALWKPLHHLFYQHDGIVDIQSSTRGQFSWGNSNGCFFTQVLAKLLCEPVATFDTNGDGFVSWKEFFGKLRDETNSYFLKIRANSEPDSEIRKQDSQIPQAFEIDVSRRFKFTPVP